MAPKHAQLQIFIQANISSNINEVIRAILNPFFFFYKKISHTQKAQNAFKRIKTKKEAFFCA